MDAGFLIASGVFSVSDLAPVDAALTTARSERGRAGIRGLLGLPAVRHLASDKRLLRLAQQFMGPAIPFRATLFDKSPTANWLVAWHQDVVLPLKRRVDSDEWGPWTTKHGVLHARAPSSALAKVVALRIQLDPSTAANGPLRVLPHTHELGVLSPERIQQLAADIAPVECLTNAGGVIAMRPLLLHASSKSEQPTPRRVLHIEYASQLQFDGDVELAIV